MGMCMMLVQDEFASIFPKTYELLNTDDFEEAVLYVGRRKNHSKYAATIDFMFCETWEGYRWCCFDYYNNDGPLLKERIPARKIKEYDDYMTEVILPAALKHFKDQSKISWSAFIDECDNIKPTHPEYSGWVMV